MKRILPYLLCVLALAVHSCTKTPDAEVPEQEPSAPHLKSITIEESSITLEPGGTALLHFSIEEAEYHIENASILEADGNDPKLFHIFAISQDGPQGSYVAVVQNDTKDRGYEIEAKLYIQTGEESYLGSKTTFRVIGVAPEPITPPDPPKPGMVYTGLPVVFVDTEGAKAIESKEDYVNATMSIEGIDGIPGLEEVACSIRGRGNTTWYWPKKPYLVKLEEKASIFGFPEHKRWVLLANFMDRTMMRNMVAMKVSSMTRLAWTPRCQPVELVLNGKHVGNYLLIEQVRVDGDRINIDKKDGYLLELDFHYDNTFQWKDRNIPFAVKHPDPDDPTALTQEKKTYIKNYIAEVSNVLYGSNFKDPVNGYAKYLDVDSFIDYWIIYEVMTNHELGNPGSVYFHKDKDGLLTAGPCWDFDWGVLTFDTTGGDTRLINRHAIWYDRLFQDPAFLQKTRDRIQELLPQLNTIPDYIDECKALLEESAKLNFQMWDPSEDASQNGGKIINGDERMTYAQAVERIKNNYKIHLQLVLDTL